jgi:NAD(P)H-hydrate epimerase
MRLSELKYRVSVITLCGNPRTPLAEENFERMSSYDISVIDGNDEEQVTSLVENADVLADGVFGTGFHGELDSHIAYVLNIPTDAYKIAVDVPSGGNCCTGAVAENTFCADKTVTFGLLKTGMTQYPLKKYCGQVDIVHIGIPLSAHNVDGRKYTILDAFELYNFIEPRPEDAHKGDFGRVFCIVGSERMRGAAALSVLGALRSGAGLVRVASVEKCIDSIFPLVPEATFLPLKSDEKGFMTYDENIPELENALKQADSVLIGCGMGVTDDTCKIVKYVLENAQCPVIVDADGINCISSDIDIILKKRTDVIITPHPGEMARLLGCKADSFADCRIQTADEFAERTGVTVVLKGAGTVISSPDGKTSVNSTGNPGMSRGGSGDVLAGMIASATARGFSVYDAARYFVYVHGLAGDIAAKKYGMESMLPRDIIDSIHEALDSL